VTGRAPDHDTNQAQQELETLARRARERLALYRRRIYLGRGEERRKAELERELQGAESRRRGGPPPP
jgi:hypothetical protein